MGGECSGGEFHIAAGNAGLPSRIFPPIDRRSDLFDNLLSTFCSESIEGCSSQNCFEARTVVRVVDVEDVFCLVDVRVDVKSRRQASARFPQYESMGAQVVVPVPDGHIERHPAEQLLQVGIRVCTVALAAKELG